MTTLKIFNIHKRKSYFCFCRKKDKTVYKILNIQSE